jgi:hypothetical protein
MLPEQVYTTQHAISAHLWICSPESDSSCTAYQLTRLVSPGSAMRSDLSLCLVGNKPISSLSLPICQPVCDNACLCVCLSVQKWDIRSHMGDH